MTIPDDIYKELKSSAERSTRSIAQEILHRIKGFGGVKLGGDSWQAKEMKEWEKSSEEVIKGANPDIKGNRCKECGCELYGSQAELCYQCSHKVL